jgi:para-aminobenzoate synthetase/4-amino-4-deoxychorismate lyase
MASPDQSGTALFPESKGQRAFCRPSEIVSTASLDEVQPALGYIDAAVSRGMWAAGYIAYEAAPAFDAALVCHRPGPLPLLWFGLYEEINMAPPALAESHEVAEVCHVGAWKALLDQGQYASAVAHIREHIAAGDTYQVNFTFPLEAAFDGDPYAWFRQLCAAQGQGPYGYLNTGRHQILSASPELFFSLRGEALTARPMKGTRPRGCRPAEDARLAEALRLSEKDRAENIMIVDMLRNDMGRISDVGSVDVQSCFDIERYPSVWQMTSTITSHTTASVPDILAALFPCGSVTGAPKVETMKIIRDLETAPRGVYCGALGWWGPNRQVQFNVPIRTVTVDSLEKKAFYAVGSGITWDSSAEDEFEECYDKAAVLSLKQPSFELLESILYDEGFFLLEQHMERLARSVAYFDFELDMPALRQALEDYGASLEPGPTKIRLLFASNGTWRIEHAPAPPSRVIRLGFAGLPVDPGLVFLYHKTTHRETYNAARATRPDCDDVLLWNEQGELTESTMANVVLEIDGRKLTPKEDSGLLGGTYRAFLLQTGEIEEARLTKEDINHASRIYLINSVRQWIDVEWVDA